MTRAMTWILLRGLTRESAHWGEFEPLMRRAWPGEDVIALDLPGNGSLHAQASPTSIGAMCEHVREELARRGVPPPYRVMALSMGAMLALEWARCHPLELRACVLMSSSVRPLSPWFHRLRISAWPALARLALAGSDALRRERLVLDLTSRKPRTPRQETSLLEHWAALHRERPVSRANAARQLLAAARFRWSSSEKLPPMLVLGAGRDALVHPECSRRLARALKCDFAEHPHAGHDLPLDAAQWVVQTTRHWLERHPT
jgi:pimeloyl-ACP methyl ester carboxylesterase